MTKAATSGWGKDCYREVEEFETNFSKYLGVSHSIATSSCTGALHLAMRTLGITVGDEVIVPVVTWIGSIAPVTYEGATPIFVDINVSDWNISIKEIEKAITPKTRAIVCVHLYGNLCDMEGLLRIAKRHGLYLVEDTAEAIGSEIKGKKAGSFGHFSTFSFHGTKTMTTGEGGMLCTSDSALYEKALVISNHGREPSKHSIFWMDKIGLKYKMSNIQAALGLSQLERVDSFVTRKREIFRYYEGALRGVGTLNHESPGDKNSYWLPAVVTKAEERRRDEILVEANSLGIGLRPFFYPLTRFPMFSAMSTPEVANEVSRCSLNLPSFHEIREEQMDTVIEFLKNRL